jgi:hypothetical protein
MPHLGIPELLILAVIALPVILLFFAFRWLWRLLRGSGGNSQEHDGP